MPGFRVGDLGADTEPPEFVFYKYTWEITNLFEQEGRGALVYAREATFPSWDFDLMEVPGGSVKYKFAGHIYFSDVRIIFYDTKDLPNAIIGWRDQIWTPEEGLKAPNDYKKSSLLTQISHNGDLEVAWQLENSWPRTVRIGDLSYSDSDVKSVDVGVAYDWANKQA